MPVTSSAPRRLTDEQRTAACVLHLFAVLMFEEDRAHDVGWYRWCVEHAARAKGLEYAVWWALRMRDRERGETAEEWLAYVEYVHNGRRL